MYNVVKLVPSVLTCSSYVGVPAFPLADQFTVICWPCAVTPPVANKLVGTFANVYLLTVDAVVVFCALSLITHVILCDVFGVNPVYVYVAPNYVTFFTPSK